ncbi:hypothetical protein [Mycoplasmoides pirum]|uniref:hypothetical protein n=1 Tax=Mycoplasmoides pirum TaxID=2122 RepID=UPI000488185B|nr:hypothetical protein [Mycoplasmoides pirum]
MFKKMFSNRKFKKNVFFGISIGIISIAAISVPIVLHVHSKNIQIDTESKINLIIQSTYEESYKNKLASECEIDIKNKLETRFLSDKTINFNILNMSSDDNNGIVFIKYKYSSNGLDFSNSNQINGFLKKVNF